MTARGRVRRIGSTGSGDAEGETTPETLRPQDRVRDETLESDPVARLTESTEEESPLPLTTASGSIFQVPGQSGDWRRAETPARSHRHFVRNDPLQGSRT